MTQRIVRKTLADEGFELLKSRIVSGEYSAGHALRQDDLAKELGISRIPLREALLRLEAEGLIDLVAHKGGVVKALSLEKAKELFELRALIECDILAKSIDKMNVEDFIDAQNALRAFDEMVLSEANIDQWTELNWQFHHSLYKAAELDETLKILKNLHMLSDRYIRKQLLRKGAAEIAHQEHSEILKFAMDKKPVEAANCLRYHILDAYFQIENMDLG